MGQKRDHKGNHKIFRELSINKNTTCQNLWNEAKALLGGKYIALNTYVRKDLKSITQDSTLKN